jgi:hypothetical protein
MPLEDNCLDVFYDDEPLRYRTVMNIIDDDPLGLAPCLFAQLHLTDASKPTNYADVQGDPAWQAAMKQELCGEEQGMGAR